MVKTKQAEPVKIVPPRKPPELMTEADDAKEARQDWRRRKSESRLRLERRAQQAFAEVHGKGFCVTKEVCDHTGATDIEGLPPRKHYKVQVTNCAGKGPPLCPITVALRMARLDIREGRIPDGNLVVKMLERATIKS